MVSVKQYDSEAYVEYEVEAYCAEEVAELGDHAYSEKYSFDDDNLPSPEMLGKMLKARRSKFDTFEIREKREFIKRYEID